MKRHSKLPSTISLFSNSTNTVIEDANHNFILQTIGDTQHKQNVEFIIKCVLDQLSLKEFMELEKRAVAELASIEGDDGEANHGTADQVLLDFLVSIGFGDIAKEYNKIQLRTKFY